MRATSFEVLMIIIDFFGSHIILSALGTVLGTLEVGFVAIRITKAMLSWLKPVYNWLTTIMMKGYEYVRARIGRLNRSFPAKNCCIERNVCEC